MCTFCVLKNLQSVQQYPELQDTNFSQSPESTVLYMDYVVIQ